MHIVLVNAGQGYVMAMNSVALKAVKPEGMGDVR